MGKNSAERLGHLSLAQLKELRAQAQSRKRVIRVPPLERQIRGDVIPLSFAQERLWFLDRLGLVGAAYNVSMALRLDGELDVDLLNKAFTELTHRHESLRTRFVMHEGRPIQIIDPPCSSNLALVELSTVASQVREQHIQRLSFEEAHRVFNLSEGPLYRATLLIFSPTEYVLLITLHHIISDGWSVAVLNRELSTLYRDYSDRKTSSLSVPAVQYADYSIWQREWLQGDILQEQLRYWSERLSGAPRQLELPVDRPRPRVASFKGEHLIFHIPSTLRRRVEELARAENVSTYMVLLASFQILLSRYSGQNDLVIGSPNAGRTNAQLENLIGFFVNMLILRAPVSEELTFRQFLSTVKEVTLGAYAHQELPFEKLVQELRPERDLSRQPIFQVTLSLQNFPKEKLESSGLTWMPLEIERATSLFDLTLHLTEVADGLRASFEYATDIFDRSNMVAMSEHWLALLNGVVTDRDRQLHEIEMFRAGEKKQILRDFNLTANANEVAQQASIDSAFQAQVERSPDALAIIDRDHSVTFQAVSDRANKIAQILMSHGVAAEQRVGLCVERSADMLIAVLGVLRAGAAYVPIEPDYPNERVAYILRDSRPAVILTQSTLASRVSGFGIPIVTVDAEYAEANTGPVAGIAKTSNLAYIIYTSGSTGRPKGVMVEQGNVINLWRGLESAVYGESSACQRIGLNASLCFDASVQQIIQLLSGRTIVVIPPDVRADAHRMVELVSEYRLDGLDCTPSQLSMWLAAGMLEGLRNVPNLILVGGEAIEQSLWDTLAAESRVRFFNVYGPTECTVDATVTAIDGSSSVPSIGRPVAHDQIYILGDWLQPLAVGVAGEIYIGGLGVSRGYLDRAPLTAERFVPDPFGEHPGLRLYRTGDIGRWRTDGSIQYIGRNDKQVKVRGYRIELGEIEAKLVEHPEVKEAVVLASNVSASDGRLLAYIVAETKKVASRVQTEMPETDLVEQWNKLHEATYSADCVGPSFVGWNSSYTNQPIPQPQMQEWLDCTLARIRALKPSKVLEIGCGVGLLLQHLAPDSARYVGTDFSAAALLQLRQWLNGRANLSHVELLQRAAIELDDFAEGSFDTIIINSVVQYFPNIDYLLDVLRKSCRLLSPGGCIFVGDVRNLKLLQTFHCAVQLSKAAGTVSVGQLRKRISRMMEQEKELVIDPDFFAALASEVPGICWTDTQIKRGRADNELTRYRYDVVLHTRPRGPGSGFCESLEWNESIRSIEDLASLLSRGQKRSMKITRVPNSRLTGEVEASRRVDSSDPRLEVGTVRRQLRETSLDAVGPERIYQLGDQHGYIVKVMPGRHEDQSAMDVYLCDCAGEDLAPQDPFIVNKKARLSEYANSPYENALGQHLIPLLREHLKGQLPEYMVPSSWTVLKALPLTSSGKVDRRALPSPHERSIELGEYVAPRSELERALADIWAEVMRVDTVGIDDNFFELGGHSLLATRVTSRMREVLGIDVLLRTLFDAPTVERLALRIEASGWQAPSTPNIKTSRDLSLALQQQISEMDDAAVLAKIAEIEEERRAAMSK
jgi:amino acid adenylation domain-containing protein